MKSQLETEFTTARINRRNFTAAAAATTAFWPLPAAAKPKTQREYIYSVPLEWFNPFGPLEYYKRLRPIYFSASANGLVFERLSRIYLEKKTSWIAESCLSVGYGWWRTEPKTSARLKVAALGKKFAQRITSDYPDHPAGHLWHAIFVGIEALTRGILDALYLIPQYEAALERINAIDPNYFYGFSRLLRAKILTKTPPPPLSIGSIDQALAILDSIPQSTRQQVAVWYLFAAEATFLKHGKKAAFAHLDAMESQVKPVDVATAVMLDQSLTDADHFRRVLGTEAYNKYTWDPILQPPRPSPKMDAMIEQFG